MTVADKKNIYNSSYLLTNERCVQVSPSAWVKLNPSVVGYYRVNYADPEDLARLCEAVRSGALQAVDGLNVLDDLFRLVSFIHRTGTLSFDYYIWKTSFCHISV